MAHAIIQTSSVSAISGFICGFIYFSSFLGNSFGSVLRNELPKFGVPTKVVEIVSRWFDSSDDYPKIPEAKGAISAIRSEAFFIPLYELFLTYGGLFRLTFGPKVDSSLPLVCLLYLDLVQWYGKE